MNFNKWSFEEEQLLLAKISDTTAEELATIFRERAQSSTKYQPRSVEAIGRKLRRLQFVQELIKEEIPISPWKRIKEIQSQYKSKSVFFKQGTTNSKHTKILSLSDIHFPLANEKMLKEAISIHADANILVLNGDILDGYAASRFEKDKDVAAIDEYTTAFEFIKYCSEVFPKVVLISGNHDVRTNVLLRRAPVNQSALTVFDTDLLARIANGERLDRSGQLVEKLSFSNVFYDRQESWWAQIGKTLFVHPHNRGSSKPGFTVEGWYKKFNERLPHGSFDSVVCGHTHKLYKGIVNSVLLIEQGCLADYMAYAWQPRELMAGNSMNGYAVIYQDENGNTNFNDSCFVFLGQLLPTNKTVME